MQNMHFKTATYIENIAVKNYACFKSILSFLTICSKTFPSLHSLLLWIESP